MEKVPKKCFTHTMHFIGFHFHLVSINVTKRTLSGQSFVIHDMKSLQLWGVMKIMQILFVKCNIYIYNIIILVRALFLDF